MLHLHLALADGRKTVTWLINGWLTVMPGKDNESLRKTDSAAHPPMLR